jgi:Mrp family chromosome partitioning ATPase
MVAAKKVLLVTGKGGGGKTTLSVNMGVILAGQGWSTGLLDADIHSPSVPHLLGIKPQGIGGLLEGIEPATPLEGLKVVSMELFLQNPDTPITWRGPIKHGVLKQFVSESRWGELDYLIIDLPAGTGDEAITVSGFVKHIAGTIIVTTPDTLALKEVRRLVAFFRHYQIPVVGVVENMADSATGPRDSAEGDVEGKTAAHTCLDLDIPFLGRIPLDRLIGECNNRGEPFVSAHPHSLSATTLTNITKRLVGSLDKEIAMTVVGKIVYRE